MIFIYLLVFKILLPAKYVTRNITRILRAIHAIFLGAIKFKIVIKQISVEVYPKRNLDQLFDFGPG